MLRTLEQTRDYGLTRRLVGVMAFTLLTALAAQIEIYFGGPVPFTLQVLAVLLAGMTLGARDGALSQAAYVALIAFNFPFAAGGGGAAALTGATAGYLLGFIPAAWAAGMLVELGAKRMLWRWMSGVVAIGIIYLFGVTVLKLVLNADWGQAWAWGAVPFIGLDLVKAFIAAAITESARAVLSRLFSPTA